MHDHLVCDDWGETKGATAALDAIAARITGGAAAERRTRAAREPPDDEPQNPSGETGESKFTTS
jgi:hypothetical protein